MINLLPPKEKQILLKERQFKETVILSFLVLTSLFTLCLILFFVQLDIKNKVFLQRQILSQEEGAKTSLDVENLENQIKGFNKTIPEVNNFLKEKYYLTDIFIALSRAMPKGLYFTNISYNQEKKEFSLTGFSQKREELLVFKENLEKEESFQDVYFPASNWLKSENIDFFVKFKIHQLNTN